MPFPRPTLALVDNGSLEPAATLILRRIAACLSAEIGAPVEPVSLLHSDKVPAAELAGTPATTFEPWLKRCVAEGERDFGVLPLFFGPSGAITDYLPVRVEAVRASVPDLRLRVAPPLADAEGQGEDRIAAMLLDRVMETLARTDASPASPGSEYRPALILVDHGSPKPELGALRERLASRLRTSLGDRVRAVCAASMERRDGAAYDFNEPLLERAFKLPGFDGGDVIVSLLFLSPGRHAGPGGDIARICEAAAARHPGLRPHMARPLGDHPGLVPLLALRARTLVAG